MAAGAKKAIHSTRLFKLLKADAQELPMVTNDVCNFKLPSEGSLHDFLAQPIRHRSGKSDSAGDMRL